MQKLIVTSVLPTLMLAFSLELHAQKETPQFFTSKENTSAHLASAVNYFVNLGEEKSAIALAAIAKKQTFSGEIDVAFRVACVCRILWRNADNPIVPPSLGMYGGGVSVDPRNQTELNEWPLFPVAKSGVSYFIVVNGGRGGTGRSASLDDDYIQRCQSTGTFLTKEITVPTTQQFKADAELLRQSDRWSKEFPKSSGNAIWLSIQSQNPKIAR